MLKSVVGLLIFFFIGHNAYSRKPVGVFYFKETFGHIHSNTSRYSSSLTTVGCGHPIKVFSQKDAFGKIWYEVEVAGQKGYVLKEFMLSSKPECFQQKYPVFFNAMNLGVSELYYWGRLYDQYVKGEVKVK